jgi:hypothetical protein
MVNNEKLLRALDDEGATDEEGKRGDSKNSEDNSTGHAPKKRSENALSKLFNADLGSLFLAGQIFQGFAQAQAVQNASFSVVNEQKKDRILYVQTETVFPGSGNKPTIYWDREIICIFDNQNTWLILTSTPSVDRLPAEGAWIKSWLAGLRIPLQ